MHNGFHKPMDVDEEHIYIFGATKLRALDGVCHGLPFLLFHGPWKYSIHAGGGAV